MRIIVVYHRVIRSVAIAGVGGVFPQCPTGGHVAIVLKVFDNGGHHVATLGDKCQRHHGTGVVHSAKGTGKETVCCVGVKTRDGNRRIGSKHPTACGIGCRSDLVEPARSVGIVRPSEVGTVGRCQSRQLHWRKATGACHRCAESTRQR